MDMNRLKYFKTVAQTGSLTKASELLGISQPALSKALKLLEQEVGKELILPSGRGIAISDYGELLSKEVENLLSKVESLKSLDEVSVGSQPLRVASFEVFTTYFLGHFFSQNQIDAPIEIQELTPGPMEQAVSNRQADIGITYLPIPSPDLDILKVATTHMSIYGKSKFFDKVEFDDLPFVAPLGPVSGTPSKAKGLDGWPDDKMPRQIMYKAAMMETALDMCRRGLCVGYFPEFVIKLHNESLLKEQRLDKLSTPLKLADTKQNIYMIKRKSDLESSYFKKLSRALRLIVK